MFISVLAERLELRDLKALLERNPDLQVILLTGRATMKQAVEAMKLGALDILEKPAVLETLVERIEEAAVRKSTLAEERIDEKMTDIMHRKGW